MVRLIRNSPLTYQPKRGFSLSLFKASTDRETPLLCEPCAESCVDART